VECAAGGTNLRPGDGIPPGPGPRRSGGGDRAYFADAAEGRPGKGPTPSDTRAGRATRPSIPPEARSHGGLYSLAAGMLIKPRAGRAFSGHEGSVIRTGRRQGLKPCRWGMDRRWTLNTVYRPSGVLDTPVPKRARGLERGERILRSGTIRRAIPRARRGIVASLSSGTKISPSGARRTNRWQGDCVNEVRCECE